MARSFYNAAVASAWMCFASLYASKSAESFPPSPTSSAKGCGSKLYHHNDHDRRSFLLKAPSLVGMVAGTPAIALESEAPISTESELPSFEPRNIATGDFDCLLDLPPITPGCVRLYLCRHGQTENNRLHLVQGARVDPPINGNGYEQAQRLGMAVARLDKSGANGGVPSLAVHSKLRRARETAEALTSIASSQLPASHEVLKVVGELPSIGEVDFGGLEGKDVEYFRNVMRATFASWSIGYIDKRTGEDGESGREVLERAGLALEELGKMAKASSTPSILAVSHSVYLRILLALVSDSSLAESVFWKIQNGAVNVVDVNVEGKKRLVTGSSGLFGGELLGKMRGKEVIELEIPEVHLIRKNEVRHLQGMDV